VQLPLEALAASGEHASLARDQLLEAAALKPFEVAVADEPTVSLAEETEEAQERPVTLEDDALRQRVGHEVAQLRVVAGQQP
jgi:hypothetical protein